MGNHYKWTFNEASRLIVEKFIGLCQIKIGIFGGDVFLDNMFIK
jgi:hypothetical protein